MGVFQFGADAGAAFSFLNWIALGALAISAQALLVTPQRINWMLRTWVVSYTILSLLATLYLAARFGGDLIASSNRTPFQLAMRALIPSWPNYFGTGIAIAVCIVYGRMLTGATGLVLRVTMCVLLIGLLLTFSRGSYIACVLGVITMTFVAGSKRRAVVMLVGATIAVGLLVWLVPAINYQFVATFRLGSSQNLGVIERIAFTREALLLWWDHPHTGIGFRRFADFADESLVYSDIGMRASQLGSVHNEYVTTLLKGGWIVAVSLIIFLMLAFRGFGAVCKVLIHLFGNWESWGTAWRQPCSPRAWS